MYKYCKKLSLLINVSNFWKCFSFHKVLSQAFDLDNLFDLLYFLSLSLDEVLYCIPFSCQDLSVTKVQSPLKIGHKARLRSVSCSSNNLWLRSYLHITSGYLGTLRDCLNVESNFKCYKNKVSNDVPTQLYLPTYLPSCTYLHTYEGTLL